MNEQQLAAVKQALEALESGDGWRQSEAITALQSIISQDALYKMAEDAVTIGLSYNDWPKIGCVNHDCDQCKAVQEPVAWFKHGPYEDGEPLSVVFENPHDDVCYSPLGFVDSPPAAPAVPLTERDLASACLSYRHDFGLMDETDRGLLMFQAREWARAFGLSTAAAPEKGQP